MNRSLLVHGCWSAAVVAAFVIGSMRCAKNEARAAGSGPAVTGRILSVNEDRPGGGSSVAADSPGTVSTGPGASANGWPAGHRPLTDDDIAELGRQFKSELDPIQRRLAFAKLLEGLTPENAKLVREQIAHLNSDSAEFREFHYAWGAIGGEDAVMNGADTPQRDMAATLAGWAGADPVAAMNWLNNLPEDSKVSSRNELKMGLVHGLANNDFEVASNFVFGLAEAGDKQAEDLLGVVSGKVLQSQGPVEAAAWAENLPAGALRASALDRVAHDYTAKDPQAAAAWAAQFASEEHGARVIEEVGDEWAERDPVSAVAWLETLESGDGKSQGLRSALDEWVEKDPTAASQYLITMPNSPDRDAAIRGFTGRLAREDPASAIAWAVEITDAGTRENALVEAGQAFFRREPDAAQAWLPESGFSPEAVQKVIEDGIAHRPRAVAACWLARWRDRQADRVSRRV